MFYRLDVRVTWQPGLPQNSTWSTLTKNIQKINGHNHKNTLCGSREGRGDTEGDTNHTKLNEYEEEEVAL